ncbi:MAG: lysoplasmalogenase [Alphaproteobacteria bacterium]|jgi:uncharacterized membrane protein YhhN|nr:lysoplasmalogenase [Alphaproteobacteria bacterium]MDP6564162.1 lysoplasmalogenase [Alphaproteobacteria bacterium]MDP6812638.1 lysoplasmalogenase [Alphaproteobacteria bacterium]
MGRTELLLVASAIAAVLFLLTRRRAPYPGSALIKALACTLLAVAAWPEQPLLSLALAASALGDWFLGRPGERQFLRGLVAFFLAHLVYIGIFAQAWAPTAAAPWGGAVMVAAGVGLAVWLLPDLGRLRVPVLAYMVAIVAMAVSALASAYPAGLLLPGVLLFLFSDGCIAVRRFKRDFAWSGEITWITYYAGQVLIFLALGGAV